MGVGGISIWQLLIILAIVIMIFGTKKLKSLGTDLECREGFPGISNRQVGRQGRRRRNGHNSRKYCPTKRIS